MPAQLAIATHQYKLAMFTAAKELWATSNPEFLVCWGRVGTNVPDQYVEFHGVDNVDTFATMDTKRTAEETLNLEVTWWVTRFGDPEFAGPAAEEYMYARMAEFERYVRVTNTTLAGILDGFNVRHTRLTRQATDDAQVERDSVQGRLAAAITIFEAKTRLTS
ncbi:hypothetical protein JNB62_13155 [Microbacterium jejuense]|uniref:Uncharacterized protein n=1 Tax=Microbacterium jejuense TaxID=1263637 RepID=A0ABS7HP46_9MICO|nr:hypothetical protein [Microbacterium jejuense]MBW9094638.1 hypothetical protein [Microbacterium jejuense]